MYIINSSMITGNTMHERCIIMSMPNKFLSDYSRSIITGDQYENNSTELIIRHSVCKMAQNSSSTFNNFEL